MARPNIKEARAEQILDAFETCVARYGVAGATLAKTAEVAGLARPLVRHNVGNRDALLEALIPRFLNRSRQVTEAWLEGLPEQDKLVCAVEALFDPHHSDAQLVQVSNALIAASTDNKKLARQMRTWIKEFIATLEALIATEYPDASPEKVNAVATGIIAIYNNIEAFYPLGNVDALATASRDAALLLLNTLEVDT